MMNPRSAHPTAIAESMTSRSTSSSTRAELKARKPFQQRRQLAKVPNHGGPAVYLVTGGHQENDLRPATASKSNTVAVGQRLLLNLGIVDKGAVSGPAVSDDIVVTISDDLRMVARHLALGRCRSLPTRRPTKNGTFSIVTIRRPRVSVTSSRGSGRTRADNC